MGIGVRRSLSSFGDSALFYQNGDDYLFPENSVDLNVLGDGVGEHSPLNNSRFFRFYL